MLLLWSLKESAWQTHLVLMKSVIVSGSNAHLIAAINFFQHNNIYTRKYKTHAFEMGDPSFVTNSPNIKSL